MNNNPTENLKRISITARMAKLLVAGIDLQLPSLQAITAATLQSAPSPSGYLDGWLSGYENTPTQCVQECDALLVQATECLELAKSIAALIQTTAPGKKSYPLSKFLRLLLPRVRLPERQIKWRAWIRFCVLPYPLPDWSKETVDAKVLDTVHAFGQRFNRTEFINTAADFLAWNNLQEHVAAKFRGRLNYLQSQLMEFRKSKQSKKKSHPCRKNV